MSDYLNRTNRAYRQPPKQGLSDSAKDKLRHKFYRARLYTFARLVRPAKMMGFVLLITGLCYLSITQLRHLFFATAYFEIKKLEVVGNLTLDRDYILKMAGIAPALNIFSIDREAIRQRLLVEPLIKDASIDLDGLYSLRIAVTERVPVLYAKVGIAFYEIADDGIIVSTEGMGEKQLPIITGLDLRTSRSGDSLVGNDGYYVARNWVKSLGSRILENISEINFLNAQNPYLILTSGEKVFPKSLEDFKNRYDFLRALLDNLRKNNVEPFYLDMRAPSEIVVRPRKNTGATKREQGSNGR
ncbi:MAG: FtsQ-type POTRA domain-containing protein [Erysipelotrichia bacterium]|nr:FtsQ-type POTRA domain-containing protein [Erysipelotrichia bacterium]